MSGIFALIPVKPLEEGKSRLQGALDAGGRARLNTCLMNRMFDQAQDYPGPARTIVVSRSVAVLEAARRRGMHALAERGCDLNRALADATRRAMALGASGVMVLPVDLPLARSATLRRIVKRAEGRDCLIASDRHGSGTNLLLLSPASPDLYRFGRDSFRKHRALAAARGLRVTIVREATLAMDVDDAADYRLWRSLADPMPCPQS